jgi:hypothetical protein
MSVVEDIADGLARETLAVMAEIGDDRFYEKVGKMLVDVSPTVQEAYMLAVRARLAEARGKKFLADTLARHRAAQQQP